MTLLRISKNEADKMLKLKGGAWRGGTCYTKGNGGMRNIEEKQKVCKKMQMLKIWHKGCKLLAMNSYLDLLTHLYHLIDTH